MMTTNHPSSNPSKSTSPIFTPLEQEILDEYSLLLDNLNNVSYGPLPPHSPFLLFSFSHSVSVPSPILNHHNDSNIKKKITT